MGTRILATYLFPTKPPTYTHTKKKLQMNCVLPHCVGCEWLHTAEVSGVLGMREAGMSFSQLSFPQVLSHGHWYNVSP